MKALDNLKTAWEDSSKNAKLAAVASVAVLGLIIFIQANRNSEVQANALKASAEAAAKAQIKNDPLNFSTVRTLPVVNRNQGLEDEDKRINVLDEQIKKLQATTDDFVAKFLNKTALNPVTPTPTAFNSNPFNQNVSQSSANMDLNKKIETPPPINFDTTIKKNLNELESKGSGDNATALDESISGPTSPTLKVWEAAKRADPVKSKDPELVIPANSFLEGVLLSGVNARAKFGAQSSGGGGSGGGGGYGATGGSISANDVGTPFVTKLKNNAVLPNGWKVSDLGDCFVGGSARGEIPTERALVVAKTISCIGTDGVVWEGEMNAYGVDIDGKNGLAGKLVSKEGRLIRDSVIAGMVAGFGSSFSPSAIPAYNSTATSGQTTGAQYPNGSLIAQSSIGQGISQSSQLITRFYLDYANSVFPVVEVNSATHITWVLLKSLTLTKKKYGVQL